MCVCRMRTWLRCTALNSSCSLWTSERHADLRSQLIHFSCSSFTRYWDQCIHVWYIHQSSSSSSDVYRRTIISACTGYLIPMNPTPQHLTIQIFSHACDTLHILPPLLLSFYTPTSKSQHDFTQSQLFLRSTYLKQLNLSHLTTSDTDSIHKLCCCVDLRLLSSFSASPSISVYPPLSLAKSLSTIHH